MAYVKTNWADNVTPLDDDALNKIENGIGYLDAQLAAMATKAEIALHRKIYFSETEPTIFDGANGDVWFTYTPFQPSQITGLKLWLETSTLGLAEGAPIASWTDISGNNNHAVQTVEGKKPIFKANIKNGLPIIRFDGIDDILTTGIKVLADDLFTIFVVAANSINNPIRAIVAQHTGAADVGRTVFVSTAVANTARLFFNNGASYNVDGTTLIPLNTFSIMESRSNGLGSSSVLINGLQEGNLEGQQWTPRDTFTTIGGFPSIPGFGGDIAEILIYNTYLSTNDRQKIELYLSNKWGVGLNV